MQSCQEPIFIKLFQLIIIELTFFLSSGLPFLTEAMTKSPDPAAGSLFKRPLIP